MTYLINLFNREPIRVTSFIRAVILLGVGFGLKVTPEQLALIMIAVEAGLALFTRTQVEPILNVDNQLDSIRKRQMINEELDRRQSNETTPKI